MANRNNFSGSTSSNYGTQNQFERLSKSIASNIQKITKNVSDMQRFINQIGTTQDNSALRDQLHKVQHYANQIAKETSNNIQEISRIPASNILSEQRQQKLQRERLINDFTTILNSLQSAQKQSALKEKQCVRNSHTSTGNNADPFSDDPFAVSDSNGQSQLQIEDDLEVMEEREEQIRQLESDIMDVNTIFKDLGMLIHEQGEVIDSIEANIETAAVQVDRGAQQLDQARNYQTKARRKKFICFSILFVVLIIIAIIIYYQFK